MLAQVEDIFFLDEGQTTEANNTEDGLSLLQDFSKSYFSILYD